VTGGSARGAALADVLAALALAALISATTVPVVAGALEVHRVRAGALYVASRLHLAQIEALRRGRQVALAVSVEASDTVFQLFADGNGNGVLVRDIDEGTDEPLGPPDRLSFHAAGVALRINQRITDMSGGWLEAGADPLRVGRSVLVSFSPAGSATAGTLYVAGLRGPQFAVRLTGATGRARLLRFHRGAGQWLP
jgi:hypothetical protein